MSEQDRTRSICPVRLSVSRNRAPHRAEGGQPWACPRIAPGTPRQTNLDHTCRFQMTPPAPLFTVPLANLCGGGPPPATMEEGEDVFCVQCGFRNPEGSKFCARCGSPIPVLDEAPREDPVAGAAASNFEFRQEGLQVEPEPEFEVVSTPLLPALPDWLRDAIRSGWEPAWWGALAAAAVLLGLGVTLALLIRFTVGDAWDFVVSDTISVAKVAGLITFLLARVPIRFEGSFDLGLAYGGGSVTLILAILGGFGLMAWLLVSAGKRTALATGARELREFLVQGAKIGVTFGIILLVLSYVFWTDAEMLAYGPSHSGAFGVGLLWGVVFGAIGGLKATRRKSLLGLVAETVPVRFRSWVSAVHGAIRGVAMGIGLAAVLTVVSVVLLILDKGFPDISSPTALAAMAISAILFLPTLIVDGLMFAHGATLEANAALTGLSGSATNVSFFDFPTKIGSSGELAPWYIFFALLVPIIAVITAGEAAAAQNRVRNADDARRVGILVGVPYAVILWVFTALARSTIKLEPGSYFSTLISRESSRGELAFGVALGGAFLLALAWGSIGGIVGAHYYLSRLPGSVVKKTPSGTHRPRTSPPAPAAPPPPTGDTIHCIECGASLPADSQFCFSCGAEQAPSEPG